MNSCPQKYCHWLISPAYLSITSFGSFTLLCMGTVSKDINETASPCTFLSALLILVFLSVMCSLYSKKSCHFIFLVLCLPQFPGVFYPLTNIILLSVAVSPPPRKHWDHMLIYCWSSSSVDLLQGRGLKISFFLRWSISAIVLILSCLLCKHVDF